MGLGLFVNTVVSRLPKELVAAFGEYSVANIGDAMGRFRIMDYRIKHINDPGVHFAGSAVTARVRAGDNLMIHKALNMAEPGDVIVVEVQGSPLNGLWGELMTSYALFKELAGVVIDGGIRDSADIRAMKFPAFARAVIAAGGDKEGPGEVNGVISCGGVPVFPGDVIVGDDDGVVVVPRLEAKNILDKLATIKATEKIKRDALRSGQADRSWVDKQLEAMGCEVIANTHS
jgi:regulator of RNase E activity RraA